MVRSLSLQGALLGLLVATSSSLCGAFFPAALRPASASSRSQASCALKMSAAADSNGADDGTSSTRTRRSFLGQSVALSLGALTAPRLAPSTGGSAEAVGPVKISLKNPQYSAAPCPPSRPIPGEKAMKGMRGLCVTVKADLDGAPDKVSIQ